MYNLLNTGSRVVNFSMTHTVDSHAPDCDPDEIKCLSGLINGLAEDNFIPIEWKCDGRDDCTEGEDEKGKLAP